MSGLFLFSKTMETIKHLQENVEITLPENGLEEKLAHTQRQNRKLIIKLGFDPTAPDLHLGHAVVLKKIKQFQELEHKIVIVVGSFTAQIGDPTGKNKSRKPLNAAEVQHNAQTYINQLSKVIDVSQAQIVFNSNWLDQLPFSAIIQLLSKVTVAQLLQRNDFNKRLKENTPIAMHELVYPILQGFDSVQINCDIEMGGTDQLFNCAMGRHLMEAHDLSPQIVMCMPLLKGLDGKEKMSKSLNNTIGLTDTPNDMFGKTMSIPDDLILEFLELTTDLSSTQKKEFKSCLEKGENPMNLKKVIAKNIITQYHSADEAEQAESFFKNQFQSQRFEDKSFVSVNISSLQTEGETLSLLQLCHQLRRKVTKSEIRRLIESGAVRINNIKTTDPYVLLVPTNHTKIQIGKRDCYELV